MKNRSGFAPIIVIFLALAVLVVFGSIFYYRHLALAPSLQPSHDAGTSATGTTDTQGSTSTSNNKSLSPTSGPVGTVVTIHGSWFGADNTIEMNNLVSGSMKNVASPDGETLSFTIPSSLGPDCIPTQPCPQFLLHVSPNAYDVSVITASTTLDIGIFTVTGAAGN